MWNSCVVLFVLLFVRNSYFLENGTNISQEIDSSIQEKNSTSSPSEITLLNNNTIQINGETIEIQELNDNTLRQTRYPCECTSGNCACCSGFLLGMLNQKACMNITYIPDEFAFKMALIMNDRVLFKNTVSGKNPPPMCVRLPRIRAIRFCARFSNIYFTGANMHVCVDADINWEQNQLFQMSFDCFRLGTQGIAHVAPEAGGGSPNVTDEDDDEDIEDYDDNV